MNTGVHVTFWIMVFSGVRPEEGFLGHMLVFSFLRELHIVLHSGYINL